jgi:pimeloyl-ACP methyl ester carboxylesterase
MVRIQRIFTDPEPERTEGDDNPMSRIHIKGRELRYQFVNEEYQDGERPLLVLLHDALGAIGTWKEIPEQLSEETECPALVYDRYGHGGSEPLKEVRQKQYMHIEGESTLPLLLEGLGVREKVIPIGHSDGGSIGLLFAAAFPDRVKGLITEAAHVFVEELTLDGIRSTVRQFKKGKLERALEAYHDINTRPIFNAWARTWLSRSFRDWDITDRLSPISAPLLAIQGEDDEYGTQAQVDAIVDGVNGPAEPFMVPACGHAPHHDTPDVVLPKMVEFIRSL